MIPTSSRRVVALFAAISVVAVLAGCATASPEQSSGVSVQPVAASSANTLIEVDGSEREVAIRDVGTAASGLVPALVFLHGATGSSERAETVTGFTDLARDNGFVVAYGQGTTIGMPVGGGAWNAGGCCGLPAESDVDDVAYLDAVIDELITEHGVDPERVYLGGFSNGGMMSYRAACELGDRVAGIVVVAGAFTVSECAAPRPLPVLIVHGTADATVPYEGGPPNRATAERIGSWINASVDDARAFWSNTNGCRAAQNVERDEVVLDERYTGCADGTALEVVTLDGVGHRWPTGAEHGFEAATYIAAWFGLAS